MRGRLVMRVATLAAIGAALCAPASAQTTTATALRTADYLDDIGVNTHVNNYAGGVGAYGYPYTDAGNAPGGASVTTSNGTTTNVSEIVMGLKYTGIRLIRDGFSYGEVIGRMQAIQMSIPNLQVISITTDQGGSVPSSFTNAAGPYWSSVVAFEGLNEARDNFTNNNVNGYPPYKGLTDTPGLCAWQIDLATAVRAANTSHGTNIPLLTASSASPYQPAEMTQIAGCVAASDASNGHSYTDMHPPTAVKNQDLPSERSDSSAGNPNWVTEVGPLTNIYHPRGGDQISAAKRELEILLSFKRLGVVRTILYELVEDPYNDPNPAIGSQNTEYHFGIFAYDWTPKAGAIALHNQFALLNDTAATARTFAPASLTYTIANAPATTYSLLMQKSDGTWVLAIWPEPETWNASNGSNAGTPINNPTTTATVTVPSMTAISLVDPFGNGTASTTTALAAGTTAAVPLSDHPIFLVMAGAAGGSPPPPTGGIAACTFGGGSL